MKSSVLVCESRGIFRRTKDKEKKFNKRKFCFSVSRWKWKRQKECTYGQAETLAVQLRRKANKFYKSLQLHPRIFIKTFAIVDIKDEL